MQKNICTHFLKTVSRFPSKVAVKRKVKHKWEEISWQSYSNTVHAIAYQLEQLQFKKGDKLGIISDTRFEWAAFDMASLCLGGITVPIYSSNSAEDTQYILNNAEVSVLIVENDQIFKKWTEIADQCEEVRLVYIIDTKDHPNNSISQLLQPAPNEYSLQESVANISLQDTATIVYTSGTTGKPKGVVLRHEQIMSEIKDAFDQFSVSATDTSLSFLPFSHIFGRCEHWGHSYVGFTMAYAQNIEALRDNLVEISPTFLVAVPRIFEKIYNSVIAAAEASPVKHKLFLWAVEIGKKISWYKQTKENIPIKLLLEYKLAHKLVFSKLAERLGGKVRFAVSGGAPLNGEIAEFFHAAGLLILEGYGLTETCAAITLNSDLHYRFGSVGKPLGDTEIKLDTDGEILIRSKKVMKEYYKNPEATKEVFTEDGFFRSGDVGRIDDRGYLTITDRKKDLIKTAGGKYIAPQKLEKLMKLNKYVSNILIHGDKKKYVIALVTLDPDTITAFAKDKGIAYSSFSELADRNEVYQLIRETVAEVNSQLASYETIKAFHILDHDFTIEGGQLTPSLKVKRKLCDKMYEKEIEGLYGTEASHKVRY